VEICEEAFWAMGHKIPEAVHLDWVLLNMTALDIMKSI